MTTADPVVTMLIGACRDRMTAAARLAINAEFVAMVAEGHALPIVKSALVSAQVTMLAQAIVRHAGPGHELATAADACAQVQGCIELALLDLAEAQVRG